MIKEKRKIDVIRLKEILLRLCIILYGSLPYDSRDARIEEIGEIIDELNN